MLGCVFLIPHYLRSMKQSDKFRQNAENCLQLAERAEDQPAFRRYLRMAQAWKALANEQDWLDGEVSPSSAVHSPDDLEISSGAPAARQGQLF